MTTLPVSFGPSITVRLECSELDDATRRQAEATLRFAGKLFELQVSGLARLDFKRFEASVREVGFEGMRQVLGSAIESLDDGSPHLERDGKRYYRVAPSEGAETSTLGRLSYRRPRYRRAGSESVLPVDELVEFGDSSFTPLAAEHAVYQQSNRTPREVADEYEVLGLGSRSVSSLQRLMRHSDEIWRSMSEEADPKHRATEEVPAAAATLCVSIDGVMVPMRPEEEGAKKTVYREGGCGTVTLYDEAGERLRSLYFGEMPELGKATLKGRLWEEVDAILERRPDLRLCAVADGAADNWTFLSERVQPNFQLVDFFHGAEHLAAAADAIFGHPEARKTDRAATDRRKRWYERYRAVLKDDPDGVGKVIRSVSYHLDRGCVSPDELRKERNYFRNCRGRMEYARFQSQSLPIGSGVTESACRTLFADRTKKSGQRWSRKGGRAVLGFHSLVKSNRFQNAWKIIHNTTKFGGCNDNAAPAAELRAA